MQHHWLAFKRLLRYLKGTSTVTLAWSVKTINLTPLNLLGMSTLHTETLLTSIYRRLYLLALWLTHIMGFQGTTYSGSLNYRIGIHGGNRGC